MANKGQPPAHFQSEEFKAAAAAFMDGLWSSPHRVSMFRATMTAIWRDFKQTGQYEQLRQSLSDAARKRDT